MRKYLFLFVIGFTLLITPEFAFAANTTAGGGLLADVQALLQGSLGTVVGLGISLFGLWVWLAQQSSWGILILIAGAAITAFPGLYAGLTESFKSAFSSSGANGSL